MNIKMIPINSLSIYTLKMFKKDSPIFLQNINMIVRQLFLLFKKSTTFWDNPRMHSIRIPPRIDLSYIYKLHVHENTLNGPVLSLFPDRQWTIYT